MADQKASLLNRLWSLIVVFGKFGAITFGGGYAILALLEEELVGRKQWLTQDELLDVVTVAESTPGPIAVNMATFVGYRLAGMLGGLVATLALVVPAWGVILAISSCYLLFREQPLIASVLGGIRIAAVVLVFRAFLKMGLKLERSWANGFLAVGAFCAVLVFSLSAILVLICALLFGVGWFGCIRRLKA
jgi:chromate transporter